MKDAVIAFHPLARAELTEAANYFEDYSSAVADRFIERVNDSLRIIGLYPESCPEIEAPIRRCSILRYWYSLIYIPKGYGIFILAVMHHSRKPDYWKDRLK